MLSLTILGFGLAFIIYPPFIKILKKSKDVQQIKEDGPTWHETKAGTPTMGGLLFIAIPAVVGLGIVLYRLILSQEVRGLISIVFVLVAFAGIGFIDDFKKVSQKQNLGLRARDKFVLQLLLGLIYLFISPVQPWRDYKGFFVVLVLGFCLIWVVGFSNAVNLTDGIDGLAGGTSLIVISFYLIVAFAKRNWSVLIIGSLLFGTLVAFLWFNFKPAKIFMGDLGSLAIGAFLAASSIQLGMIWSLLFVGLVFVGETLSDIIQVGYHHFTGKRVFKMAPMHHHLELSGWSEEKINYFSYILTLIVALTYIILMKV
ncbi:phospho-N-acetylmuramoyl-pentapeptide-transferase [Xylocopilactobacillus apicola]|uniref:Phospho-N-acetylmuramoyl-pentapeptide-transferase n=1 Tax=Xylocopilactobacillus apicola TaxID=2932184 RepID=A0AAU9D485_9LACO|nr:phospho-N-acetylmuramoyl-pentapeptide-transferase [Xylocopilactobacillus apicola]